MLQAGNTEYTAIRCIHQLQKIPMTTTDTSSVLTDFIDYAAEGEEPADLLLSDLIPPELSDLNLPHAPKATTRQLKKVSKDAIRIPSRLYRPLTA